MIAEMLGRMVRVTNPQGWARALGLVGKVGQVLEVFPPRVPRRPHTPEDAYWLYVVRFGNVEANLWDAEVTPEADT